MTDVTILTLFRDKPDGTAAEWRFDSPQIVRIGRDSECDVVLEDRSVSRSHATIEYQSGEWILTSHGTNGVYCDGELIENVVLENETVLLFSKKGPALKIEVRSPADSTLSADAGSVTLLLDQMSVENEASFEDAAKEIWNRYFQRIAGLSRKRFGENSRAITDEEDVASAVLLTLIEGLRKGRFPELSNRKGLWQLLAVMTSRRTKDELKRESSQKRGGGSDPDMNFVPKKILGEVDFSSLRSEDPTPEYVAVLAEQIREAFNLLPEDEVKEIALKKLEGYTNQELAESLNISERTIERRLALIRETWKPLTKMR